MAKAKDPVLDEYAKARKSGAYMVCIWSVAEGQVSMFRQTSHFPMPDFGTALNQLKEQLTVEMTATPQSSNPQ